VRAPEALQLLADPQELAGRDPAEVAVSVRSTAGRYRGPGAAVAAARALRRYELLRIACADLLGLLDVDAVCVALSSVWAAVLAAALDVALRAEIERRQAEPARIAVIAMGRLGGAELGYNSDADVLFVCEAVGESSETDAMRFASSVAESVRNLLGSPSQDPPLVVDTGLRPEGRSGPLVRTLASYQSYYTQWSQPWEAQALLRARPVAGDMELGERFISMIDPVLAKPLRSGGSRRESTPSGCPAAPTPPPTPSLAAAAWPTWSGPSSCCSCSMLIRSRRYAPHPRRPPCRPRQTPGCSLRPTPRSCWLPGSSSPKPATFSLWSAASRSTNCPHPAGNWLPWPGR
jgi:hypothetical protein